MENKLKVEKSKDKPGCALMDACNLEELGIAPGSVIEIEGKRTTAAIARKSDTGYSTKGVIYLDNYTMENAGVNAGENVSVKNADTKTAEKVIFRPIEDFSIIPEIKYDKTELSKVDLSQILNHPLRQGDIIPVHCENELIEFVVEETVPEGTVVFNENTVIQVSKNIIKNTDLSPEHENNVLGKFREAEKAFLDMIRHGTVDRTKYDTDYDIDYLKIINPLTEIVNILKKFEEEIINLQKLVRKDPNDVLARYDLALRLHALRRYEDAEEEYNRALTLAPDSAVLHAGYANLLASGRLHYSYLSVKKEYMAAIELNPDNIEYRLMLAKFCLKNSYNHEAYETLQDIIKLKPDDARAYKLLGNLCFAEYKKYADALNYYKKYIELEPDDHVVHYALGQIYCRLKRFKDAKREFKNYIDADNMGVEGYIDSEVEECIDLQRQLMEMESESDESCPSCSIKNQS